MRIDGVCLVAVCNIDYRAARDTVVLFKISAVYTDGMQMLEDSSLDAALWSIVPAAARDEIEATTALRGIYPVREKP